MEQLRNRLLLLNGFSLDKNIGTVVA